MASKNFAVSFLCLTALWADCPDGVYTFTDADKKFMTDAVAAVRAALPPAPVGWRIEDPLMRGVRPGAPMSEWVPPISACKGADKIPLITGYGVKYIWDAGAKDLDRKDGEIRKKMQGVRNTPMAADEQARVKELGNKDRDLRYQARKLEKTDKAEADRLRTEAAVYAKQVAEIQQAHMATLKPQLDALQKEEDELMKGRNLLEVGLNINVNDKGVDTRRMTPATVQPGAFLVGTGTSQYGKPNVVWVYGGPWKKESGALVAAFPPGANIRKAHNVVVTAEGDSKQNELILSKLDVAALKALLVK